MSNEAPEVKLDSRLRQYRRTGYVEPTFYRVTFFGISEEFGEMVHVMYVVSFDIQGVLDAVYTKWDKNAIIMSIKAIQDSRLFIAKGCLA